MTPTNHLDELKKLRDNDRFRLDENGVFGPVVNEVCKAALDHIIKREESLADAEGHAAVLRESAYATRMYSSGSSAHERQAVAYEAGALALTERPALIAECERLRNALERMITFAEYARYELEDKHSQMEQFPCKECCDKELATARLALKESHNE